MTEAHIINQAGFICDDILSGAKAFEVVRNGQNYNIGDIIKFHCVDEEGHQVPHEVTRKTYEVTYFYGLEGFGLGEDCAVIGFREEDVLGNWTVQ